MCMSRVLSQEQLLQSVADTGDTIKPLANAAKGEAEKLGHQVAMTTHLASLQLEYSFTL